MTSLFACLYLCILINDGRLKWEGKPIFSFFLFMKAFLLKRGKLASCGGISKEARVFMLLACVWMYFCVCVYFIWLCSLRPALLQSPYVDIHSLTYCIVLYCNLQKCVIYRTRFEQRFWTIQSKKLTSNPTNLHSAIYVDDIIIKNITSSLEHLSLSERMNHNCKEKNIEYTFEIILNILHIYNHNSHKLLTYRN